jgi:hypothetical protein
MLLLFGYNTHLHQFSLHTRFIITFLSYCGELNYHCSGGYWVRFNTLDRGRDVKSTRAELRPL